MKPKHRSGCIGRRRWWLDTHGEMWDAPSGRRECTTASTVARGVKCHRLCVSTRKAIIMTYCLSHSILELSHVSRIKGTLGYPSGLNYRVVGDDMPHGVSFWPVVSGDNV